MKRVIHARFMASSSAAFQRILIGCVAGLVLGSLYMLLLAPIKDRESYFGTRKTPEQSPPSQQAQSPTVAQADGYRSIMDELADRDTAAFAQSSYLTVPSHPLDPRYRLPEPVELPRSLAKYLRV